MKQSKVEPSFQVVYYYQGIKNIKENILLSMVENMGGKLTASNRYIAQYLLCNKRTASDTVNRLVDNGYINSDIIADQWRTITLTDKCIKLVLNLDDEIIPLAEIATNNIEDKIEDKINNKKEDSIEDIVPKDNIDIEYSTNIDNDLNTVLGIRNWLKNNNRVFDKYTDGPMDLIQNLSYKKGDTDKKVNYLLNNSIEVLELYPN